MRDLAPWLRGARALTGLSERSALAAQAAHGWRNRQIWQGVLGLLFLVSLLYWPLRNHLLFGNPTFPYQPPILSQLAQRDFPGFNRYFSALWFRRRG